jgi:hypothetical protein
VKIESILIPVLGVRNLPESMKQTQITFRIAQEKYYKQQKLVENTEDENYQSSRNPNFLSLVKFNESVVLPKDPLFAPYLEIEV